MEFDQIKILQIENKNGLHARAASKIAMIAKNAMSNVWIVKDDQKADASSILDILMLDCAKGTEIAIEIDNHKDINILNNMVKLVKNGFGE